MTEKEINKRENEIYYRVYKGGVRIGKHNLFTDEEKQEMKELDARSMINSVLIYGYKTGSKEVWDYESQKLVSVVEHILKHNRYVRDYAYNQDYYNFLGEARTMRLIEEQVNDFAKAEVGFAGYDSEGVSYNYCRWGDED